MKSKFALKNDQRDVFYLVNAFWKNRIIDSNHPLVIGAFISNLISVARTLLCAPVFRTVCYKFVYF